MAMAVDCDTHYWEPVSVWKDYIEPQFRDTSTVTGIMRDPQFS